MAGIGSSTPLNPREVKRQRKSIDRGVKMCARTSAAYQDELWGPKEEKKPQRQLLDAVFNLQPRIVLRRADITEYLHRERQKPVPPHVIEEVEDEEVHHIEEEETNLVIKQRERAHPHIKEGEKLEPAPVKKEDAEEYPHIKHEVEEDIKFPPIGVSLKSVDEGRSEESRGAEPPSSNSSQHVTLEGDGSRRGGSQPGGLLATLSDSDDKTSHSSDYDNEGRQSQFDMTFQTDNKQWNCSQCGKTFVNENILKKHMKTHSAEKLFACLVCGQRFSRNQHLRHARTHTGKPAGLFDKTHSNCARSLKLAAEMPNRSSMVQTHKSTKHMTRYKQIKDRKHPTAKGLLELSGIQGEHSYAKQATPSETSVTNSSSECVDKSPFSVDATSSRSENLTSSESAEKQSCSSQRCKMKRDEYQRLLIENSHLKSALNDSRITQETFKDNNKKVNYYTGLQSYKTMITIFEYIEEFIPEKTHTHRSLSKFQKFILALMKLRHNFPEQDLAYRFDVSQATVSRTFLSVIHVMYIRLQRYIYWPEREDLRMSMPLEFRKYFSLNVCVIIDCLEIFIERPSDLKSRAQTWSSYQHHNTAKYLLGITPQGSVSFISKGWGGRTSDKYITENCGLLKKLHPGDVVLAYRGFDTKECVGFMCAEVKIPGFTKGRSQLPGLEIEKTRSIALMRIHGERVMNLVRNKYMILSGTLPTGYLLSPNGSTPAVDKIVTVCCCLANFCSSVAPFN
ncbi:uncharacterized protein LOC133493199 isoform X3 [Syngnathoides biaculeatus]|uniref:uncharacterized protein LOC133493199 isoform X3 n=1 Tax=Syngnathoides biaculeatus TaxID=300417 RepID=UPI002ADDA0C1|nr:uncharacterized protein LOC133493199 isoform X3 [Syngnathoides biaculeatus]